MRAIALYIANYGKTLVIPYLVYENLSKSHLKNFSSMITCLKISYILTYTVADLRHKTLCGNKDYMICKSSRAPDKWGY